MSDTQPELITTHVKITSQISVFFCQETQTQILMCVAQLLEESDVLPGTFLMVAEDIGFSKTSVLAYIADRCSANCQGKAVISLTARSRFEEGRVSSFVLDLFWKKKDELFKPKAIYMVKEFQQLGDWYNEESLNFNAYLKARNFVPLLPEVASGTET